MIQSTFSQILALYIGLLLFGWVYNILVGLAERKGYLEGYTWLAVVIGVLITMSGIAILNWQFALLTLGAFTASGAPMAAGSIWRHVTARKIDQDSLRNEEP